ncbi:MAG: oligosaccharide flippase family protein [Candidatus Micrarchaeales archaeon]|jgi:O-antigen/teichoic acid export membrane protein
MESSTDPDGTLELGVRSARVASFVAVTQILAIVVSGITLIVVARFLGSATYGIYTLAIGTASFVGAFGGLGINNYINKHVPELIAKKKKKELQETIGTSLFIVILLNVLLFLLGILFSGPIASYVFHNADYTHLVMLSIFSIIFTSLMFLEYYMLISFGDGIGSAISYTAGTISISLLSILLVYLGYNALGAIIGLILGSAIGALVGFLLLRRHTKISLGIKNLGARLRHMFFFSTPLALANALGMLMNNFAVLLLGIFSIPSIVGAFGVADALGSIVSSAMGFTGSTTVQMFSTASAHKKTAGSVGKLYNYSIYFGILITAPIAVFFIALSHAIVNSVFPTYTNTQFYIPILTVSVMLVWIGAYATLLVISSGKTKKVLKYSVIVALAQFVSLLVLVPLINAYGAIIGFYFVGGVVSIALYVRYVKRTMHIKMELGKVYRILIASFILLLVLLPVNLTPFRETIQLIIGAVITLLLYPALLIATKAVTDVEWTIIYRIIKVTSSKG